MLNKYFLVALIAVACVGCVRDRAPQANTAGTAVAEPTRISEIDQPAQVQRDPSNSAVTGPPALPQPQGIQALIGSASRTAQINQPQPAWPSGAYQSLPVSDGRRQITDDCQNGNGSGQSDDCQDRSHGHPHHDEHVDERPHLPDHPGLDEKHEKLKSSAPKVVQAPSANQKRVSLLFYHMQDGCPHCAYERPQIRAFEGNHSDVVVTWRHVGEQLSARERELLRGTSGHPIMAFYTDDGDKMIVRGETSATKLDANLSSFKKDVAIASQNSRRVNQTTGSNIVCQ